MERIEDRWYVLAYLKPSGSFTQESLIVALAKQNIDATWADYFGANQDNFADRIQRGFGEAAATFYETLISQLHENGEPLSLTTLTHQLEGLEYHVRVPTAKSSLQKNENCDPSLLQSVNPSSTSVP